MKQRRRRITAMLLAAAMSVSLLPNLSVAFAAPTEVTSEAAPRAGEPQVGDVVTLTSEDETNAVNGSGAKITHFFTITITGENTCSIKEFNRQSKETSIKIPSYVTLSESNGGKTYNVTAIDDSAFASCGLTEVSFRGLEGDDDEEHPCKITTIGANAFASNLFSTITLPKEVTTIGDGAFSGASSLKTININELTSLTSIGANAFRNCTSLEELDMSATALSTIGMQTFYGSKALKYIKLPKTITSIGSQAFSDVAKSCFVDCSEVTKGFELTGAPWGGIDAVIYWGTNHGYDNNSPYIFDKDTGLIYGLKIGSAKYDTSEHKYTIDSTTKADNINYWYYSNKTLNGDPFNNPYDGFTILDDTKKPDGAPADVNLVEITLPEKIRVGTWTENTFDEETSTEYDVKGIAEGAFGSRPGNVAIKKIDFTNIKGGMDKIPYGAFWNATNLTDVLNIPEGVTSVGTYAFRKCTSLGKIELPSTVQEVNQWAFRECDALTTVTFNTRDAAEPSPAPTYEPPTEPGALTPIEDGNTYYTITQKAGEEIIGYIQGEIDKPTETDPVPEAEAQVSLSKVVELNGRYYVYSGSTYAPTVSLKWSDDGDGNGHYTGEITDYEYDSEIVYFAEAETLSADNAKNETEGTGETPAPDVAAADKGKYSGGKFSATKSQNSVTYLGENKYTKGTYSLTAYYIARNDRGVEIRTETQSANKSADNCLLKLIKSSDGSSANSEIKEEFTLNSEEKIGISGRLNGNSYNQGAWIDYVILRKTAEEQTCDIKKIHSGAFSKCKVLTKINMKGQFSDTDEKIYVTGTSDDDDPAAASAPFGAYDADIEYKDGTFDKTNVTSVEEDGIWTFNRLTGDVIGYDVNNKENVTDSNYKTKIASKEITIPSELSYKKSDGTDSEKIKITGVGQYDENRPLFNAYHDGRVHIKNITIPDGVVRINDSVFYRTTIEDGKIKIPDSVESIRYRAFSNCGLKELTLPANLKTMGSYAFGNYGTDDKNNVPLNDIQGTVVFPRHIENIPNDVFSGNSSGTKTSPGNENIDTIHIQQYRYLETDAGYPERTDTFRQAAPEVYNNAPFGAKQDSEKASTVEYEDAYIPVLSDPEDTDHYHPTIAIEGKPDQKKETEITPEGGGDPITVKGGTAQINLALIMENSAFTIINAKSGVENESNEYFKNAAVTVTKPQLQSSGKYDGSQPYELNVTGITGNGSFVIEYSYGDVDGHLIGTNAVEIPIDCFHTAYYHDNNADSGVAPQLGTDDGNGDAHYYVEGFNVSVRENDGNGKPGNILKKDKAVFMGWYVSDSAETPAKVKVEEGQTGIDLHNLESDPNYIPEKMPTDIVLASLEDPSSTAEMGETDLHFHAVWAADANGDGIPETSITGVNTVNLTYDFNGGKDKDSNEQYVASDVEKATNWPIADTEPKGDDVPKKEGATLVGWSTAPNNTGTTPAATKAAVDDLVATEVNTTGTDPKVYAVWAADEYPGSNGDDPAGDGIPDYFQVKYEAGDGVSGVEMPVDNNRYEKDDDVKVKPTDYGESEPTRKGWKFEGWTLKDGDGTVYKSDGVNKTFKKNDKLDILVAKWTPEGYAVVYHGNGNTGGTVPADQSVAANSDGSASTADITVADDEPTRDYAVFLGWTTEQKNLVTNATDVPTPLYKKDGTTETFTFTDSDSDRVMDLYAVWAVDMLGGTSSDKPGDDKPDYKQVFYDANVGGQEIDEVKSMPGDDENGAEHDLTETVNISNSVPTRTGYVFKGWADSPTGPAKYKGASDSGADRNTLTATSFIMSTYPNGVTLYAIWEADKAENFVVIYRQNHATSGSVPTDSQIYKRSDSPEINVMANKEREQHDTKTQPLSREGAIFLGWTLHPNLDLITSSDAEGAAGIIENSGTAIDDDTIKLTFAEYEGNIYNNVLNIFAVWAEDVNNNKIKDYEETTWFVKYNLNGGTYTDGEIPLDKGTDDKGYLAKTTAELKYNTVGDRAKFTKTGAVLVGWTETENPVTIDKEGTNVPEKGLIEHNITMPDDQPTADTEDARTHNVYAVWAVDENSNGEADYLESKVKLTYNYNDRADEGSPDTERVAYYDKKRGEITPNPNYHPEPRGGKQEVFIGWSKDRKADAVSSKPSDLLEKIDIQEENVIVYAVYAVDTNNNGNPDYADHSVTFDDGDSSALLTPMPSLTGKYKPGEVITIPGDTVPTREGYTFAGWKLTEMTPSGDVENSGGLVVNTTQLNPGQTFVMPGADVTFTAQWEEKTGTVVYNKNLTVLDGVADTDVTAVPTDNTKYAAGDEVTIASETLSAVSGKELGAVFLGWSHDQRTMLTSAPAEGSVLTADKTTPFAVNTDGDIMTLYAVWALDADKNGKADYIDGLCTIVYDDGVEGDPSGVTNLPPTVSVNPEEDYTISDIEPSRTGYRFTGWKIKDDDTNYRYNDGTRVITADKLKNGETVTLVAQWEKVTYQVVYHANNGTGTGPSDSNTYNDDDSITTAHNDSTQDKDGTVTTVTPFTRDGYVFVGWTVNSAADPITSYGTAPTDMIKPGDPTTFTADTEAGSRNMNLYAVWAVDANDNETADYNETKYNLTYDRNGGKINGLDADHVDNNEVNGGKGYLTGTRVPLNRTLNMSHDEDDGTKVVFVGWSATNPGKILSSTDTLSGISLIEYDVEIKTSDNTVYAVWAYDRDGNNVADYLEGKVRLIYDLNGGKLGDSEENIIVYYDAVESGRTVQLNNERRPERTGGKHVVFVGWSDVKPTGDKDPIPATSTKSEIDAYLKTSVELNKTDVTVYAVYAVDEMKNGETDTAGNGVPDYNKYTVTYDLGDYTDYSGDDIKDKHDFHEPGDEVDLQTAPARDGYTFAGWKDDTSTGGDGSVYMLSDGSKYTMPERNVKFVAQWVENGKYIVRYHGNGHTNGTPPENNDKYTKNTDGTYSKDGDTSENKNKVTLAVPSDMERNGATFLGWSVNEPIALITTKDAEKDYSKAGEAIAYAPETGGVIMNLYAVWAIDENGDGTADYESDQHISVTFEANDSTPADTKVQGNTMPANATVLKGVDYNIPGREPVRAGYTFLGWKLKDDETSKLYKYGTIDNVVDKSLMTKDITLVAQWGADYGVVYHANGGTGAVPTDDSKYELGSSVTVEFDTIPTRDGYVFLGWSKNKQYEPLTAAPSGDDMLLKGAGATTTFAVEENSTVMNLYALWTADMNKNGTPDYDEQWHIIYNHNGGTFDAGQGHNDYTVSAQTYNSSTDIEPVRAFLNGAVQPTHEKQDGYDVVFVGWTTEKDKATSVLSEHVEDTAKPTLVSYVTIPEYSQWETYKHGENNGYYPVYAVWGIDKNANGKADYLDDMVRLIYDFNGGTIGETAQIIEHYKANSSDVVLNEAFKPTKDNAVFIGWSKTKPAADIKSKEEQDDAGIISTVDLADVDVTVYAVYAVDDSANGNPDYNTHTLTYENGVKEGEKNPTVNGMPSPLAEEHEANMSFTLAAAPTRDGYDFIGWQDSRNSAIYKAEESYTMPDEDVTLTAVWNEKGKYSILYHGNGSTGGAVPKDDTKYVKIEGTENQYHKDGDHDTTTLTLKQPDTLKRDNAVFLGWSVNEPIALITTKDAEKDYSKAGEAIAYAPETGGVIMNLYAVWAINENGSTGDNEPDYNETKLNITYANGVLDTDAEDSKDVANMPPAAQVLKGLRYTIPNVTPSRTGYTFVNWSDGAGNTYKPGNTIENVSADITLTATWEAAYHVSYNANNGTNAPAVDKSKTFKINDEVTIDNTIPTRVGYAFLGWTAHEAQDPVTTKEKKEELNGSILAGGSKIPFALSPDNETYMIFYAVWAVDANKNGTADYDEQWHILYDHNGGTFDAHQDSEDYTISALTYPSSPNTGDGDMVFLNNAVKPTHTAIGGVPVTFAGWTTEKSYAEGTAAAPVKAALSADEESTLAEKLVDYVRMPKVADWNIVEYQHDGNGGYYPVYAVWATDNDSDGVPDYQEGKMRLIYNLDGGEFGGGTADIIRYLERPTENGAITLNESFKPTRGDKEVFVGWTTIKPTGSPNNAVTADPTDTDGFCKNNTVSVTANQAELTVYAVYAKDEWGNGDTDGTYDKPNGVPDYNKHKVTYDLGMAGGTAVTGTAPTDIHTDGHEPGDLVDLAPAPEYTGFSFVGWKDTGVDGSDGSVYMPDSEHNSKYTMPDRDVKFVAQWIDSDRYMVRYHLNGGTGTVPENSDLYAKSTKSGEDNVYYLVNEDDSVTETKTVTLAAADTMSRGNAVFLGWSVNEPKALVTTKDADTGYSKTGDTIDYAPETGGVIMNLYAVWAADENGDGTADYVEGQHISVTFEANDSAPAGTQVQPDTMPANATVLKGVDYNIPGREPVRAGYTFLGWKIQGGDDTIYKYGGDNAFVPKDKMGANITLVAQWGADYGIAYHANGGTGDVPTDENKYELGANVTVKFDPIPTRAGYIFLGWSKNKQYEPLTAAPSGDDILLKGTAETTAFAVEENSTVMNMYALWTADANNNNVPDYDEQWHIVYDHNGGTFDAGQGHNDYTVSAQTYNSSTDIEPVRAFLNGSVKPTHEKQGDTAVVFVGWTLKKTENILPSNVPSAEQPELITNVTMPQQSEYAEKDGKVTVYAVWALDVDGNGVADYLEGKVRLIYNANGGKFGMGADASTADIIVYYDAADERTVTLNESRELSRNDGEVFVGWSITKPTGDKDPITVGEENRKSEIDAYLKKEVSLTTEDVTVYAVYAVDEDENGTPGHGKPDYDFYTVTYELNGGISVPPPIDSNKYEPDEIVTIYGTEPMLANSAFDGWKSSDESDTTKYRANDSFVMPAQDITLTAQWTEKTGNVKYNLNGGTGTAPIDNASYDAGDVVTVKEASDITRDKAVFLGWSHDKRSTLLTETPAENSILNADGTTGANGGGIAALKETTFAPDEVDGNIMTLYAVWAADTNGNGKADYTEELWHIVYDHNGGTYNDEEKTTSSADYLPGTTVALHADILPIREPSTGENSYHFVGWTMDKRNVLEQNDPAPTDDDLITQVTIPTENTDDNIVTVYALWAIDTIGDGTPDYQDGKVKLIYNFDGGTFSGRQEIDRYLDASEEDRTITLNETFKPVRGDKEVFVGWTSTVPPTEHRAAATAEPEDLLKNGLVIKSTDTVVTVYAVYAVDEWGNGDEDGTYDKPNGNPDYNKHKVTYDLGYYPAYQDVPVPGEAPTDAHNVTGGHEPGDFVDLQTPPTVDGVIFEGWKDIDGDDSVYMPGDDGRKYTMPDREVEFVAQWIKGDRYTVKYNANDVTSGDVPTDDTEYILEETTQTPELTKYFYFISSGENAGTRYYNVNVKDAGTLKKDNAVFVGWTLTPLDPITLDPDKEESKVTYYTEATTDLAYAPEEGGKIMNLYALWAVDSDGDGVADYAEGKYAIEYKNGVNEGDADYENPQIKNMPENADVLPNEDYTIPNYIPTRPHYTFECWADGSGKTYQPGDKIDSSAITGTVTLTAQWLPDNTVKYHANNGAGTPPVDDNKYADGINITLAAGDGLTMEKCVFIGWTLHESYPVQTEKPTITFYTAGAQIPYERDKNTTVMNVYALWAVDENGNGNPDYYDLTLSFADGVKETDSDYNAGISPVRSLPQSIEGLKPGVSVTLPDQKPTRVNYNFMGWIDPANPSKLLEPGDNLVMPDTNVTLTASWEKKSGGSGSHGSGGSSGGSGGGSTQYTLKYETNGGSEIADERYSSGKEVTLDKTPTREGYVFDGWYSDKGLTEKAEKIKMTKNTTVYAKWVEEKPDDTKDPSGTGSGSSSSDILNTDDHFAYVMGYEDSTVRPNNNITRAETVAIFYRLLKADVRNSNMSSTNKFEDVSADNWYNVSVSTMANVGIVSGRSDTEFAPEAPITRAEFAAICARFDDSANVEPSGFSDIDGHWAKAEVERAAALGWVSGYEDGTFRPDRFITRAEAMTMINRVLGRIPESVDDLSDGMTVWSDNSDSTAWFYLAVQEATNGHYAEKKNDTYEKWTKVDQSVTWDK